MFHAFKTNMADETRHILCTREMTVLQQHKVIDGNNYNISDCPAFSFGRDCTSECHCVSEEGCDSVSGACISSNGTTACTQWYAGESCATKIGKYSRQLFTVLG